MTSTIKSETRQYGAVFFFDVGSFIVEDIYNQFVKDSETTDDNDHAHLFQKAEDCTDIHYCPPDLSLKELFNLQTHISTFSKNDFFYAVSADAVNCIGKGTTQMHAVNHLLSILKKAHRCGYGGIYPQTSSASFHAQFVEKFASSFIDYHLIGYNSDTDGKYIKKDATKFPKIHIHFDQEILSTIVIRRLLKRLIINNNSTLLTYANYIEWIRNDCLMREMNHEFGLVFYNQNISFKNLCELRQLSLHTRMNAAILVGLISREKPSKFVISMKQ